MVVKYNYVLKRTEFALIERQAESLRDLCQICTIFSLSVFTCICVCVLCICIAEKSK